MNSQGRAFENRHWDATPNDAGVEIVGLGVQRARLVDGAPAESAHAPLTRRVSVGLCVGVDAELGTDVCDVARWLWLCVARALQLRLGIVADVNESIGDGAKGEGEGHLQHCSRGWAGARVTCGLLKVRLVRVFLFVLFALFY